MNVDLWGEPIPEPEPASPVVTEDARARWVRMAEQARERERRRWRSGNPLVKSLGPGPDGVLCGSCANFLRLHYHNKTYLKCEMRGVTHGAGTDHRAGWPACVRYEAREEAQDGDEGAN